MKKTSLYLVAALAATTFITQGRANQIALDTEAIANMGDQQCRDYVARNVRAILSASLRDSLGKSARADDAIETFKALKADLDRGQRLLFGIGPRADNKDVHAVYLALLSVWETKKFAISRVIDLYTLKEVIDVFRDVSSGTNDGIDLAQRITARDKELAKWRADVRKMELQIDAYIERHQAENDKELDALSGIERKVRQTQQQYCDTETNMSLPSSAEITGVSIGDFGVRTNGPMFKTTSRPAPMSSGNPGLEAPYYINPKCTYLPPEEIMRRRDCKDYIK